MTFKDLDLSKAERYSCIDESVLKSTLERFQVEFDKYCNLVGPRYGLFFYIVKGMGQSIAELHQVAVDYGQVRDPREFIKDLLIKERKKGNFVYG